MRHRSSCGTFALNQLLIMIIIVMINDPYPLTNLGNLPPSWEPTLYRYYC